jgi:type I restriction enzyme R subunit
MSLNESIVEDAALEWFGELGYAVGHGPQLAPGEYAGGTLTPALSHGERESYGEVVLVGRLREAIRRLNSAIPEEASACALHADRRATIKRYLQVRFEREMNP